MHMHLGLRKIWQAAAVVKVHVGQDDVTHIFRLVSQAGDLTCRGLLGLEGHNGDDLKNAQDSRRMNVILLSQPGVHKDETLLRLDQQAECAGAPMRWHAGVACETIKTVYGHACVRSGEKADAAHPAGFLGWMITIAS
jgi:hypothetical protein